MYLFCVVHIYKSFYLEEETIYYVSSCATVFRRNNLTCTRTLTVHSFQ